MVLLRNPNTPLSCRTSDASSSKDRGKRKRPPPRWIRQIVDNPWLAAWKILFAMVAILDIATCWPVLLHGWLMDPADDHHNHHREVCWKDGSSSSSTTESHNSSLKKPLKPPWAKSGGDNNTFFDKKNNHSHCTAITVEGSIPQESLSAVVMFLRDWIGPIFCVLCLVEAIFRAKEARTLALETQALDQLEQKLRRVYSTTRMSFKFSFFNLTQLGKDSSAPRPNLMRNASSFDEFMARSTLRTWIPTMAVISFWCALLPFLPLVRIPNILMQNDSLQQLYHLMVSWISSASSCQRDDKALATQWIWYLAARHAILSKWAEAQIADVLWKFAFPYNIFQPKRFYTRLRQLLRWIRYARFAFPLVRMCLKLNDQFMALFRTWHQSLIAQTEKAKRIAERSLLLTDIRKIESLAKVQTALARIPSHLFRTLQHTEDDDAIPAQQKELARQASYLQQQQQQGRWIQQQVKQLKLDLKQSLVQTSDLYDRVVQLTQELKVSWSKTLLSSHHLISPHSRFSLIWRVTVTNCLLMEFLRLVISWYLTNTFKLSTTQIISRLFIECQVPEIQQHFAFFRDRVDEIRKHLSDAIPLLPPPDDFAICVPSSSSARLLLQLGGLLEGFVDVVSFADIFIWFFTGDLDMKGVIIPKPFFTRCILPGTVVQVLDHPTLPETLPALITKLWNMAIAVGCSRSIRWILAIGPAFIMLVVNPFKSYFFRHMDIDTTQDLVMRYAESCGILSPLRRSFGSANNVQTSSLSTSSSIGLLRQSSSHSNISPRESFSQVGLSFDSPQARGGRKVVNLNSSISSFNLFPDSPAASERQSFLPPSSPASSFSLQPPSPPLLFAPDSLPPSNNKTIRFESLQPGADDSTLPPSSVGLGNSGDNLRSQHGSHSSASLSQSSFFLKEVHPKKFS